VCIVLDAFRWDYLNPVDTPLLHELTGSGVYAERLVTTTGFTQRSALFSGTYPDRTGNFSMFTFDPDGSPFSFLSRSRPLLALAQRIVDSGVRGTGRLDRRLRAGIASRAASSEAHPPTAFIPLHLLPMLGVSEDAVPIHAPRAFSVESLFDLVHRRGLGFTYLMYPAVNCADDAVLDLALSRAADGHRLYLLQFSESDAVCHVHGPESPMRRRVVGELDRKLRVLRTAFEAACGAVRWVILGDHGMMEVTERIDVARSVHGTARRLGWRHGREYVLFLDSTFARVWALTDRAQRRLGELLAHPELARTGGLVTAETASRYRIPWGDRRYGDLIWWARPGVLIAPDYFHAPSERVQGMHGYDAYHEKMQGFALVAGEGVEPCRLPEVRLVDICPTLCSLLGLPPPAGNEGESLCAAAPQAAGGQARGSF
jgi:predicted AlkP superfamily pyrophosphatase or phosphodiesterase